MLEKDSKKQLKKRAESNEALTSLKNQLSGVDFCYKIKLRSDGYRLVYQVKQDDSGVVNVVITVITVDRREDVYESLQDKSERPLPFPRQRPAGQKLRHGKTVVAEQFRIGIKTKGDRGEDINGKAFGQMMRNGIVQRGLQQRNTGGKPPAERHSQRRIVALKQWIEFTQVRAFIRRIP